MASNASAYQQHKRAAKRMIEGIPETGATIIVLTNEIGRWLKQGIREMRGAAVARRCRAIAVARAGDESKIEGLRGHVVVDWSFMSRAKPDLIARVERLVSGIRAMQP